MGSAMMGTAGGEKSGVIVSTEVTVSTSGWDWLGEVVHF